MATDDAPRREGFLRRLLSDHKAFASLVGLLVYGVVRVAYDAYYTRLGVFPEAVGLSEATILGRAALYLALTVSIAAIFGGAWLLAAGWSLERSRARRWVTPQRLLVASAVLAAAAAGFVAAGGVLRSLLGSYHLAYYCFQRCKFAVLNPGNVDVLSDLAEQGKAEHPSYRFVDFGPAWLVALPLGLLLIAAAAGLIFARVGGWGATRTRPLIVFAVLAEAAMTAGLLAPHLIAVSNNAASGGSGLVDAHPALVKWIVFTLLLGAVGTGLLAVLDLLAGPAPRRSPWLIASFVVVLPLLLGFFEPNVPLFIEEEGGAAVAAAVVLWSALLVIGFWLWPHLRDRTVRPTAGLGIVVAIIVSLTLFLAWERGLNLAKQAAMGDQIFAKRFSLLSVRASLVCLEPTETGTTMRLPRRPYVYLGETGGTLVLYDYVSDLAREVPTSFPLRMPSAAVVRLANFDPSGPHAREWANWDCRPNT